MRTMIQKIPQTQISTFITICLLFLSATPAFASRSHHRRMGTQEKQGNFVRNHKARDYSNTVVQEPYPMDNPRVRNHKAPDYSDVEVQEPLPPKSRCRVQNVNPGEAAPAICELIDDDSIVKDPYPIEGSGNGNSTLDFTIQEPAPVEAREATAYRRRPLEALIDRSPRANTRQCGFLNPRECAELALLRAKQRNRKL